METFHVDFGPSESYHIIHPFEQKDDGTADKMPTLSIHFFTANRQDRRSYSPTYPRFVSADANISQGNVAIYSDEEDNGHEGWGLQDLNEEEPENIDEILAEIQS